MSDFDEHYIIVNFSTYMHAKQMILYSFEKREHTLTLESKIVQIESLDVEKLATKVKKLKLMYWTRLFINQ